MWCLEIEESLVKFWWAEKEVARADLNHMQWISLEKLMLFLALCFISLKGTGVHLLDAMSTAYKEAEIYVYKVLAPSIITPI